MPDEDERAVAAHADCVDREGVLLMIGEEEREYPREPEDTRPARERPFVGRWPNPLWVGLLEDDAEDGEP